MNTEREMPIPGRASSGTTAALELSFQWITYEGPPTVDMCISRLGHRIWGESWHFLPGEAERLADLLDEAASAVGRKKSGPVGHLVHADRPPDQPTAAWLTVAVAPPPYLKTGAPRVRLQFDDEMTAETPDVASLWFTVAASQRLARRLRETAARALSDETARRDAYETVVPLNHSYPNLIPGHLLSVTGVGLRAHRINVYWVLTPPLFEDELSRMLPPLDIGAVDDLGYEYSSSGCGYSSGTDGGKAVTRGLFALKPGARTGAMFLWVLLQRTSRYTTDERDRLEVDLRHLDAGIGPA